VNSDERITWVHGEARPGPRERIGVLEIREDGAFRVVLAERVEVDGRCHVLLARRAWGGKDARETKWWSLSLNAAHKIEVVRNGSCGDRVLTSDVPRITRAIEALDLMCERTMIAVDDGPAAFPWLRRKPARGGGAGG
jgi:hypothetical protein